MKTLQTMLRTLVVTGACFLHGCGGANVSEDDEEPVTIGDDLLSRVLKFGDTGSDVLAVQRLLDKLGYNLDLNQSFDSVTERAVTHFQTTHQISITKKVGATTYGILEPLASRVGSRGVLSLPAGYLDVPIAKLRVLNACSMVRSSGPADKSPGTIAPGSIGPEYDYVFNGTFMVDSARVQPAGDVMRQGVLESPGIEKAYGRGGVAILSDGTMRVIRQRGAGLEGIQSGLPQRTIFEYVGGGALLIENGVKVESEDLLRKQRFEQGSGGINAQQMNPAQHTFFAIDKDGRPHVVIARYQSTKADMKSGAEAQADMLAAGVVQLIKFDGSSGFVARSNDRTAIDGANGNCCSGFAVRENF
jgi:Putative peptidoglycan binding domain/Phosphodiester glycosidase